MQLPADTRIAGLKTVDDWINLKTLLANYNDMNAWHTAYSDFYLARLKDRYLAPLTAIKEGGTYSGEGFSIMAIICSLIEFLESTFQGINYRYRAKKDRALGKFEYGGSSELFVSFLTQQTPFNRHFDQKTAEAFYKHVRCGLLHEARTKGKWTIWGSNTTGALIEDNGKEIIVYRDEFLISINTFIESFKNDLLGSSDRKDAFIRRFDNLCNE
jgi:hypothetical protein